jgi:hypothetical protein
MIGEPWLRGLDILEEARRDNPEWSREILEFLLEARLRGDVPPGASSEPFVSPPQVAAGPSDA